MLEEEPILAALSARGIVPDSSQRSAITAMLALLASPKAHWWRSGGAALSGVYCHGLPGRGKSLVMDTVYALAPCPKQRIHFHEFLRGIIRRQMTGAVGGDSLVDNARAWLGDTELLCFDEFHVHDIADAFLIGRFLDTALSMGIRVVATSNYPPDGLLPDPLYHDRFQPTIDRIKRDFAIVHFDGAQDYRFTAGNADVERLMWPISQTSLERLQHVYDRYEGVAVTNAADGAAVLQVAGRVLNARRAGQAVLWADFDELCVASRSHLDYLDMAERWQVVIVDQLWIERLDAPGTLQRFIWLVDILYDRKLMLLIASDQPLVQALSRLEGAHDLSRTLSRLAEMQSADYGPGHKAPESLSPVQR